MPPSPADFGSLQRWVRIYSIWQVLLVAIILWGAHFFALFGRPWTTCMADHQGAMDWRCIAFFHIYEAPIVVLFLYHAWVGLRRFTYETLPVGTLLGYYTVFHRLMPCFVAWQRQPHKE